MTIKSRLKDASWYAGGVLVLVAAVLLALHYHWSEGIAAKEVTRVRRLELVERLSSVLSSSSEAEKSAVMAVTDEESQEFADRARAASAEVEQTRDELAKLLETGGTRTELDLLSQFSRSLTEFERIDRELLDLAVRNTNLKAYALDFGPAAEALAAMDGALSRILKESATSTDPAARRVMLLAAEAQSGAWRIQALLPPHISEESDRIMDELEARMATEDRTVRSDLEALAAPLGSGNLDLEKAMSSYARFTELRTQILELSRQNTNVRSLIISLNQKRKVVQMCKDALDSLAQTIREETLNDREPMSPR
jgi:hypothetical protein